MKYPPGDRGTIDFTQLIMETLFYREEVEEEEVEEEESGYKEDKWRGPIEDLLEWNNQNDTIRPQQPAPTDRPAPIRQEDE